MGNCFIIMKKVIKECDFFGTFITFRINDEIQYKSITGGIISILFFILSVLYTIYVGYPFIKRENIDFIFSNKILETQPYINLTSTNFNLGFGIQYQDEATTAIFDYIQYFNYSLILKEWIGLNTIITFPFGLKQCNKSDFFNLVNESFERNNVGGMLCPILNESVNYTLDGLYTDDYYKFFEIEIKLTEYGMNNLNELKNLMEKRRIEMAVYFIDHAINYQNRHKPLPIYINYLTREFDLHFVKTIQILISTIEFTNDENLFFKNEKTIINAAFDKIDESFYYIPSRKELNDNIIGKFIIKTSSKTLILNRSYQKFPSFIADLAGILEELLLFILFTINIIERQVIENKLIHKMLKMKGSKNHDIHYFLSLFNKNNNHKIINMFHKNTTGNMLTIDNDKICFGKIKNNSFLNSKTQRIESKYIYNSNSNINNNFLIENSSQMKFNNYINGQSSLIANSNIKNKFLNDNKEKLTNKYSIKEIQLEDMKIFDNRQISINQSINKSSNQSDMNFLNEGNMNNLIQISIKKDKLQIKQAEEDFPSINIVSTIAAYFCFWFSKYQKRRFELLRKAEKKIHYYLEIFNYIKTMQEIDLIKYCLFDKDEVILLNYLSYPPFSTCSHKINEHYQEFEREQIPYQKIQKTEVDEVYNCYNCIKNKENITEKDIKLLKLIDAEADILG